MASGLETVSLINGSIDVIKLTQGLYHPIKTFEGLPKAFEEVNKQLPLVQDTLTLAKGKVPYLDDATRASVKETLQQCGQNVQCLLEIFEALKDAEGRSIKKAYSRVVIHIGKRQDKIQVDVQSRTTKKLGHRHKPQEKSPLAEFTSDDLCLYTQPLELKDHEVGRAARVTIAEDGGLIRIGPKIYIRDGAGDFKLLDLGYTRARYVE
ncbi:hypothetical protein CEP51_000157 [Fusarium floridanum]|uniref:NACHT-NTPase and P-loop NTPases N-terminal domain-containing protein n=1 Tax=Fusarium floridanum TaxID=1325733 RepID=A0A428SP71_9HYPO|nr:hypothetical protein CEP51_000157 [Fusarium floridanum]